MTKSDQIKVRLLVLLLAALAATVFFGYRMNRTPNPAIVQAQAPKIESLAPVQTDAKIRLDLLERQNADQNLGKNNLFQYRSRQTPATPSQPGSPSMSQPPANATNPGPILSGPPIPPPLPPIPLKYIGFAYIEPNSKQLIATLSDDSQRHFNAVEGDVYQGRYRVTRITDTAVDVEDLEFNRRQTLPLIKQ